MSFAVIWFQREAALPMAAYCLQAAESLVAPWFQQVAASIVAIYLRLATESLPASCCWLWAWLLVAACWQMLADS